MTKNLPIRYKLLLYYTILFTVSLSLGSVFTYILVRNTITKNIESELEHTTQAILNMVKTSADVSIKNHLRAIAEKNEEIAQYYYDQYQDGKISEDNAKQLTTNLFLNQTIGKSGYTYCLDSSGVVVIHPEEELLNTSVAQHEFIQRQIQVLEGYLEYQWKNPKEKQLRPKAMYMTYFEPWDWIISVTSYRKEFKDVVNVNDFKDSILKFRFGKTGYSFVIDSTGTAIIHPKLEGVNVLNDDQFSNQTLEAMVKEKKGKYIYPWKNPDEPRERQKLVIFNHIPEYDWMVASSSYLDEFYRPLMTIRSFILLIAAITIVLIIALTFKISASITKPLKKLTNHFDQIGRTNFSMRMEWDSKDEIGQLASYFNDFMEQLEQYSNDLNEEIKQRRKAEAALRMSQERYQSVMEATPDPIVLYNMKGEVIFFNPAFTRVFGWRLEECIGRKMDYFVPDENWPETRSMIKRIRSGESLSFVESCRLNNRGDIVPVTISGATYKDPQGNLVGSVIILRDITKTKRLRKQIMDISENERQKFGQCLHDDLSPHMIGVQGLCTVLETNLKEESSNHAQLAAKITVLVRNAIKKIRALSRGLCPVHLVSHGLFSALEDLAARTEDTAGIRVLFKGNGTFHFSDNIVATHLYFIAQEAVTNAIKHSNADEIIIELSGDQGKMQLSISDNGNGFEKNESLPGIGLQIMEYRVRISGATMRIITKKEHGTIIRVLLNTVQNG
ncbi:MAG: cache domain-containing protein [Desulfobacterales bacterium]